MSEQTPDGGSPCLVFREIPYDYLVDFGTNLINSKNNQIYPAWREDHKDIMVLINNLLAESFIKAASEKKFTFQDSRKHEVVCKSMFEITKAWKQNPQREEDYAFICRGHFLEKWEWCMERQVMAKMGITYPNDGKDYDKKKGCIARLCIRRRTEMVKNWNVCGKKEHGNQCLVTRTLVTTENKFDKRNKTAFYFTNTPTLDKSPHSDQGHNVKENISPKMEGNSQDSQEMLKIIKDLKTKVVSILLCMFLLFFNYVLLCYLNFLLSLSRIMVRRNPTVIILDY